MSPFAQFWMASDLLEAFIPLLFSLQRNTLIAPIIAEVQLERPALIGVEAVVEASELAWAPSFEQLVCQEKPSASLIEEDLLQALLLIELLDMSLMQAVGE
mmetsp:Transcript_70517/g.168909  ORF Transcript_70517/g.168909 Transcript_70517/m.168909 type:complete len:101 (+) Transcript_70517:273-575(+)